MIKRDDCENKELEKVSQQRVRKPYRKPKLTEYGHVEKLTKGFSGGRPDGLSGRARPQ